MPTYIRAQCSYQVGTMAPRDAQTINPCFQAAATFPGDDPSWQQLAEDLATAIKSYSTSGAARQLTVKMYEIKDPVAGVPNRPKGTAVRDAGVSAALSYPGEIAVCLSFYGGSNAPHQRGRLYIPWFMIATGAPAVDRPGATERGKVVGWATRFADLGGVNVDWGIYSRTRKTFTKATNVYCDDEFDTQRRRGLKPTTRTSATTSG